MEAVIYDNSGKATALPTLLRWDFSHGFCSPCDSFEATFLYDPPLLNALKAACRFRAVHEGGTVFFGVVDEFEAGADGTGCVCVLRGRGMQALLLDSQAESAEYYGADAAYILKRHVTPFGITDVDVGALGGKKASLSVSSGESHWSVLSRFAEFCLGVIPRFTPEGRLLLDGEHSGRSFTVTAATPVTAQVFAQDRYGVISEAIVKNRALGTSLTVRNEGFLAMGGKCVRVVNVPRKTGFDAMRHTGAYQIGKSKGDLIRCRLTLPALFAAFPGDRAVLESTPLGVTGEFYVSASRCFAAGASAGTVLDLRQA